MRNEKRDEAWLEHLYRTHFSAVLAYATRRVRPDEADDIAATVFLSAWQRRDDVPEAALPWLYRAAANHVQHARRGEARRGRLAARAELRPVRGSATTSDYEVVDEALDAARSVEAMLAELPERDAEVLRLAAWENLDAADIAAVLGVSVATARTRLSRARRRGSAILDRLGDPPSGRSGATQTHRDTTSTAHPRTSTHPTSPSRTTRQEALR